MFIVIGVDMLRLMVLLVYRGVKVLLLKLSSVSGFFFVLMSNWFFMCIGVIILDLLLLRVKFEMMLLVLIDSVLMFWLFMKMISCLLLCLKRVGDE